MPSDIVGAIVKPTTEVLAHIGERMPGAMGHAHNRVGEMAHDAADHFDQVEENVADRVPVYLVDKEGKVSRLRSNGEMGQVSAGDTSGIRKLLDKNNMTATKTRGEYNLPRIRKAEKRKLVDSEKIPEGSSELARATQRIRRAKADSGAGNYAAVHYKGGGNDEFILVGRSVPRTTTHSEQTVGVPFLKNKGKLDGGVVGAYTERGPCEIRAPKCAAWLRTHFPNTPVTHSFDYGPAKEDEERGNLEHAAYIKRLMG
jgi:Xanthomonas XOO_2897-like deaminase